MTADIELLPLPAEDYVDDEGLWEKRYGPYSHEQMEDYARANVAHATAAKGAEIDVLRTRLEDAVRDSTNEIEALRAERDSFQRVGIAAQARAERLAEALRIAEAALADIGDADREPGDDLEWCERRARLGLQRVRDTLRDHDQEVGNG